MGNAFDFELVANDKASEAIARIDEAIRKLDPQLQKTRTGLQLGGQDSVDGLNDVTGRLETMSRAARDNVQFIGDIVPPLKMVSELSGKYGGIATRLGVAGAGAYALAKGAGAAATELKSASDNAYRMDVAAKNAGMRVDEFSRLAGAMQILGSDSDSAGQAIEGFYKTFNDALQGRNGSVLAVLAQMGVQIEKNRDGTADVMRTMESLARIFPSLTPEKQKTVADALGLDADGLRLLREGARLKELLAKSDQFGLTVDPKLNDQLLGINRTLSELGASWEGLKQRSKNKLFAGLLSDGSVKDGLEGFQDLFTNGLDSISLAHVLGATRGKEADQLREGYNNQPFYESLSLTDKVALDFGVMTDSYRQRYAQWKRPQNFAEQLQGDMGAILRQPVTAGTMVPYGDKANNALGLRNNNPGNLRAAPNSTGMNQGFATFANDGDGLAAMARQLMLYGDRGNNTLSGIISTYAPRNENDTQAYINEVSGQTGYGPRQPLNMHNPETLRPLMAAMIHHENGVQPFTPQQLNSAINSATWDERWAGLRDDFSLSQQRGNGEYKPESVNQPAAPVSSGDEGDDGKDSILSPVSSETAVTPENLTQAFRDALDDQSLKIELTLVNSESGQRRQLTTRGGGRITVPMQNP